MDCGRWCEEVGSRQSTANSDGALLSTVDCRLLTRSSMAIPLKYSLRNLFQRKVSTVMTVFVVCLVVMVFLFVLALWQGVSRTLSVTASNRNIITMRVGSQAEMQSVVTRDAYEMIRALPGIEKNPAGEPYVSPELISLVNLPRADGQNSNVQV